MEFYEWSTHERNKVKDINDKVHNNGNENDIYPNNHLGLESRVKEVHRVDAHKYHRILKIIINFNFYSYTYQFILLFSIYLRH